MVSSLFQQAALVLNASCRFRYTLDLKEEERDDKKEDTIPCTSYTGTVLFAWRIHFQNRE
jgi:hypothetical protein